MPFVAATRVALTSLPAMAVAVSRTAGLPATTKSKTTR
jgi:hypothetical protein